MLLIQLQLQLAIFTSGSILFPFAGFRWFFKTLVFADFSHQTCFFAGFCKTPERFFKRFALTHFDIWQVINLPSIEFAKALKLLILFWKCK